MASHARERLAHARETENHTPNKVNIMKKVLIPTKLDTVAADLLRSHGGYEVVQDDKTPFAELVVSHPDTYALIVRSEAVTAEMIDKLPHLKVIAVVYVQIAHKPSWGVADVLQVVPHDFST